MDAVGFGGDLSTVLGKSPSTALQDLNTDFNMRFGKSFATVLSAVSNVSFEYGQVPDKSILKVRDLKKEGTVLCLKSKMLYVYVQLSYLA